MKVRISILALTLILAGCGVGRMSAVAKRGATSRATAAIIVDQVLSHGHSLEQALPQKTRTCCNR